MCAKYKIVWPVCVRAGVSLRLSVKAEEVAGFYACMLERDYTSHKAFNENFFRDWRKCMNRKEATLITDLRKCDFGELSAHYRRKAEDRKAATKQQKQASVRTLHAILREYGYCIVDGHRQKIANFKIEPPGLFCGRGQHPKMGMVKRRVLPEDVIINIGKEAPVPKPPRGHSWKEVRHDRSVSWLASWNVLGRTKYVTLNASAKLRAEMDVRKYELARKLKSHVPRIRRSYANGWESRDVSVRQRSVALYFIDKLALRAGNEQEEGATANTVGCCSLRVEHITLRELETDSKDGQFMVEFDFPGKDSIRYANTVRVDERVFRNLELFMEHKGPKDDLFDLLTTATLNRHLNKLMEGLTAKVFRTYNASMTFQKQLDILTEAGMSLPEKLLAYNRANRAVAILCNHRRAVPKNFDKQMERIRTMIEKKEEQIRKCELEIEQLEADCSKSKSQNEKLRLNRKGNRLQKLEVQLDKLELQALDKEENKDVALVTSKLNYIDPRISVAWCKTWDVPIEKVYNKTQREKFYWAIETADPNFEF
ncbi:DNA topoisomerase 1 [Dermacentor silvarum]|uniref:DNA topoisomerase 1 n=1 Tax=Dermacentor silvarum TaxID=543639 RepID=UPI002101ADA7|nr:DNA topoisomerase 1 [Dermacentor silvarum]